MNRVRSAYDAATASCVTIMMVACSFAFSTSSVSRRTAALRESSAPVGSSARTSFGSATMARAAATRWRWPPDIWRGYFRRTSVTPSMFAVLSTFARTASAFSPLMVRARAMFSKPVSVSSRLASWKMKPRSSRRNFDNWRLRSCVMSSPLRMMFPLVTVSMVEMQFKSVLLPEPDGPITPTNSPSQMSNDTSSSARVTASREP